MCAWCGAAARSLTARKKINPKRTRCRSCCVVRQIRNLSLNRSHGKPSQVRQSTTPRSAMARVRTSAQLRVLAAAIAALLAVAGTLLRRAKGQGREGSSPCLRALSRAGPVRTLPGSRCGRVREAPPTALSALLRVTLPCFLWRPALPLPVSAPFPFPCPFPCPFGSISSCPAPCRAVP